MGGGGARIYERGVVFRSLNNIDKPVIGSRVAHGRHKDIPLPIEYNVAARAIVIDIVLLVDNDRTQALSYLSFSTEQVVALDGAERRLQRHKTLQFMARGLDGINGGTPEGLAQSLHFALGHGAR